MAQFPSVPVAQKSYDFRTLGLGYANLGALLMVQGIPYDSPEGRAQCGAVTALMHAASYATSAEMAGGGRAVPALRGQPRGHAARHPQPSPGRVQRAGRGVRRADHHAGRHRRDATAPTTCSRRPAANATACCELGEKHGYRNAQVTCIAPTGTIGLVMDCDTTGIEPDFALVKFKKLAGGGYFKIINASIPPALARLGYTPRQIEDIVRYCRGAGTLARLPAHQPRQPARPRASPTTCCRRIEAQLPGVFELPFAFNRWTVGDDVLTEQARLHARSRSTRPSFDLLTAPRLHAASRSPRPTATSAAP